MDLWERAGRLGRANAFAKRGLCRRKNLNAKNPPAKKIKMPQSQTMRFNVRYFFRMREKIGSRTTKLRTKENTRVSLWLRAEKTKRHKVSGHKNIFDAGLQFFSGRIFESSERLAAYKIKKRMPV